MKFDKETLIAILIAVLVLIGWEPFCRYMGWVEKPATAKPAAAAAEPAKTAPQSQPEVKAPTPVATIPQVPETKVPALPPVTLRNELLKLEIQPSRGAISAVSLLKYENADHTGPVVIDQLRGTDCGALELNDPAAPWKTVRVERSTVEGNRYTLIRQMQTVNNEHFVLTQTWELLPNSYRTKYHFVFTNASGRQLRLSPVVFGGDLAAWSVASGDPAERGAIDHRLCYLTDDGQFDDLNADTKDSKFFLNPPPLVDWAGVANKYFCSVLDTDDPFGLYQARSYIQLPGESKKLPVISCGARLASFDLAISATKNFDFVFFSGPKLAAHLKNFNPSADRIVHLSWGPLDYLAKFLLWCLIKLHDLFGNYGVSIIILTLLVRGVFYPVSAKANASMKKMQAVQPKLKELREKYKDNPQLMNTKMMELYRQEGVNPFGGCLPMLFQIPVFIALYHALNGAVQLRQATFLWCRDLAQPDTVATLNLHWFSLDINPLALAMTALMVLQQRITPMGGDPTQRKMMALMPIIMLFFLYNLPSGLTLYWTVSNCFSIVQLYLQHRNRSAETGTAA